MMEWWRKIKNTPPVRTTGESGQVLEWRTYALCTYGKLIAEIPTEPLSEDAQAVEEKHATESSSSQVDSSAAGQTRRLRRRNTLNSLPTYITTTIFFLLPLDFWLAALIHHVSHNPSTVPTPQENHAVNVLFLFLTILLFNISSCIAFHRGDISFAEPWAGLFSFFAQPLLGMQLVGQTTTFRWPIVFHVAMTAGVSNALFLRKTVTAFNSTAFSSAIPSPTTAPKTKILLFLARLLAKAAPTLFLISTYIFYPPENDPYPRYLTRTNLSAIIALHFSLYGFHVMCTIFTQQFLSRIIPRIDCGPLYAIIDDEDWTMEVRVGKGTDPGTIREKKGGERGVKVVMVGAVMALGFAVLVVGWNCVGGLMGWVMG